MPKDKFKPANKVVETIRHYDANRKNIPTAEYQSVMDKEDQTPIQIAYERRNRDLDPQLVWRGKDEQDWSELVVHAPPIYIQEKIHPKALIKDLLERSGQSGTEESAQASLFGDFNGIPAGADKTDFYQHDSNWTNRMILGDSLQVMASLAEREGLRGQVQCIYLDPPYGIKFNSNFQWSTTSRDVKDGKADHITREPEMVKAFRDTWRDGMHSYLTYLRDRLTVARDLLTDSGSIFVQIGPENVHRLRSLMDELFGDENFMSQISYRTSSPLGAKGLPNVCDYILWYAKSKGGIKYRQLLNFKGTGEDSEYTWAMTGDGIVRRLSDEELSATELVPAGERVFARGALYSSGFTPTCVYPFEFFGETFTTFKKSWRTNPQGMSRLIHANRLTKIGSLPYFVQYHEDFPVQPYNNLWVDTRAALGKRYVVETSVSVIQRCVLMVTDPGDLVLDPTCGSGTTATVAEQWGRRWITIDTSRVALALARSRVMGARYAYYLLADSPEGQQKEAAVTRTAPSSKATFGNIRHGFVYERVPHITLKSIANNAEIDVIWTQWETKLAPQREKLTSLLPTGWLSAYRAKQKYSAEVPTEIAEWEIPRKRPDEWPETTEPVLAQFWEDRIARQKEIDASIAAKADFEYLYDKPYEDRKKVRVAGPFTVESLSPHRTLAVGPDDELIDPLASPSANPEESHEREGFVETILETLKVAGVQQANKEDKIDFQTLTPWPGRYICAEGRYEEAGVEKRAGIFLGPEFGTVSRPDLVEAAREAGDADFDVLIACAFNFDAHSSEFDKLGRIPVLKARMNADLQMAGELKNTGAGNLFVIFGEPDIDVIETGGQLQVQINGVDVFDPRTGEVRSDGAEGIACWFLDTDYNGESFFVRHAYFLGANDPYKSLKTTLKAEINEEAWATLNSDISRPFEKPKSGRIAVKVINHLGDEVMKVFKV